MPRFIYSQFPCLSQFPLPLSVLSSFCPSLFLLPLSLSMQKTVPYQSAFVAAVGSADPMEEILRSVRKLLEENAVVVFALSGCCMCPVVRHLLHGHGVNPTILHVDKRSEDSVIRQLLEIVSGDAKALRFPATFVGGKLLGGLDEVMRDHISGELVPKLIEARALWL